MSSAALSSVPEASPTSFAPDATVREISLIATGSLVLLAAEALSSNPRILFARYLWIDELWTKLIESKSTVWESLVALEQAGDPTPPMYHLLARASWGLLGGSAETAFRTLSFVSMWIALVLLYVLLRRSFALLPALVAVIAFWSCPTIIGYAFYARPYASLLAATVGFCLVYGQDRKGPLAIGLTAAMAALICTLHYFGIFALSAVVIGDTLARHEPLPAMIRRNLPTAAGPIALAFCWPFVHAWRSGQAVFTFLPPLTLGSAVRDVLMTWILTWESILVLFFAWYISAVIWLIAGLLGRAADKAPSTNIGRLQPVAGLFGLILVPILVALFSALTYNVMLTRYMIPGLLGVAVLLALVASKIPSRILAGTAILLILLGAWNLRLFSEEQLKWQTTEGRMINIGQSDDLFVVTLTSHEAYLLYEYAPRLRNRLVIADFRASHRSELFRGILSDYELESKWSAVFPDLPKFVSLEQMRAMERFHLVNPETAVLADQENRPATAFPLQKIAQALSLERVGDLYEVRPNWP